jgi:hypothetical protein
MENCQAWKIGDPDCIPFVGFTPDIDGADYIFKRCISVRETTDVKYSSDATQGWYTHGVAGVSPGDVTIENCEAYRHGAAYTAASSNLFLRNCYAESCRKAVATGSSVLTLIENNEFKDCERGVEVFFTSSPVRIINNKIYGNLGFAVFVGVNTPIEIINNVFDTTFFSSFAIYLLQSTEVSMTKTIINGFRFPWNTNSQDYTKLTLSRNLYFPEPTMSINFAPENFAQWQGRGIDLDSTVADPKYAEGAPVFSLRPDSPAIPLGAGLI